MFYYVSELVRGRDSAGRAISRRARFVFYLYHVLTAPLSILVLLDSPKIHPRYHMTLLRKLALGLRMFRNNLAIPSGTNYRLHLAMALKLLETPPERLGCVIECGTWKGVTAANLSLVCRIVGRKLLIYDSFEGLPRLTSESPWAGAYEEGAFLGTLDEVRENVRRYGALACCTFVKGWFSDTLPNLDSPVVLAYLDVDLGDSLNTCVRHIWPNLVEGGYLFTDEALDLNCAALFFSERWWQTNFGVTPPGLIGSGSGLPLGTFFVGPVDEMESHPLQQPGTGAGYARKGMSGYWSYYPEEAGVRDLDSAGAATDDAHGS